MNQLSAFEQVKEFHTVFDKPQKTVPTALTPDEAFNRAAFSTEEILEFLYASVDGELAAFEKIVSDWQKTVDTSLTKIRTEQKKIDNCLIGQVDALTDANYFNYGSFVLMGVNPDPIFSIVHEANMGKLFPDGKPHYREHDGKVRKPENWEKDFAPEPKIQAEIEKQIIEKKRA